jgi:hypothetical protein
MDLMYYPKTNFITSHEELLIEKQFITEIANREIENLFNKISSNLEQNFINRKDIYAALIESIKNTIKEKFKDKKRNDKIVESKKVQEKPKSKASYKKIKNNQEIQILSKKVKEDFIDINSYEDLSLAKNNLAVRKEFKDKNEESFEDKFYFGYSDIRIVDETKKVEFKKEVQKLEIAKNNDFEPIAVDLFLKQQKESEKLSKKTFFKKHKLFSILTSLKEKYALENYDEKKLINCLIYSKYDEKVFLELLLKKETMLDYFDKSQL